MSMNLPERCDLCLKTIDDHLFHLPCTVATGGQRFKCGSNSTASVFGLAGKLLQERNEAIIYIKQLESTISPVRDWFDGDGENTDVLQMLTEAISELQKDRKELLSMGAGIVAGADKAEIQVDWYSPDEVREWLTRNNYSTQIAGEIAGLFAEHMQKSFNKGHEVAERKVAELELKIRAADVLVRVIDRQTEIGLLGSRTGIADARLDYGTPFKYEAKEHTRIAALEEDLKNTMEFIEYVRDSLKSVTPELRIAARKILMGEDW